MTTILDVYRAHGVDYVTEGGKVTEGWAGSRCPHCRSSDYNLGVHLASTRFSCWRCGAHGAVETIALLCGVDRGEALRLWRSVSPGGGSMRRDAEVQRRIAIYPYRRPPCLPALMPQHRRYLEGRGFDPDLIIAEWGVSATGPVSRLDGVDYRHRLLVPIAWEGREVSFQARDHTGRSDRKYMACPSERERVHHKDIIYCHPRALERRRILLVEGVTDVWRLGDCAAAVFGIAYRREQVAVLARLFDRVTTVFDGGEEQARRQARHLRMQLTMAGVETEDWPLAEGDPGSMSDADARHLAREAMGWAA